MVPVEHDSVPLAESVSSLLGLSLHCIYRYSQHCRKTSQGPYLLRTAWSLFTKEVEGSIEPMSSIILLLDLLQSCWISIIHCLQNSIALCLIDVAGKKFNQYILT